MFTDMEKWVEIRRDVLVGGKSKRQAQRETGLAWKTLDKVLANSSPPGYRRTKPYEKPKIGPDFDRIAQIIEADRDVPRKQRHTAKRIYERIREEGYRGRYTQVHDRQVPLKDHTVPGRRRFAPSSGRSRRSSSRSSTAPARRRSTSASPR